MSDELCFVVTVRNTKTDFLCNRMRTPFEICRADRGQLCVSLFSHGLEPDVRPRHASHSFTKVEASVLRLVIGHVLPCDAQPVSRVVHQGVETMPGWYNSRIDP